MPLGSPHPKNRKSRAERHKQLSRMAQAKVGLETLRIMASEAGVEASDLTAEQLIESILQFEYPAE